MLLLTRTVSVLFKSSALTREYGAIWGVHTVSWWCFCQPVFYHLSLVPSLRHFLGCVLMLAPLSPSLSKQPLFNLDMSDVCGTVSALLNKVCVTSCHFPEFRERERLKENTLRTSCWVVLLRHTFFRVERGDSRDEGRGYQGVGV